MATIAQPSATAMAPSTPTDQRDQLAGLSIVTALVNGIQVPVACPAAWCTEKHATEETRHAEDVDHFSDNVDLYVPAFNQGGGDLIFAYAHIGQDLLCSDQRMREPHIRVEDGGGESSYMTPAQALEFANNLEAFAEQVRGLVRTAQAVQA